MASYRIPFNKPYLVGKELTYIAHAVVLGQVSGDGHYTRKCHTLLQEAIGAQKVLLTTSCTHALELSALLLDINEGDEVIVPSFTFVSTANAYALQGARIAFADCRSDTLNIDETKLEELITSRTKAIVVVHYGGVGCEMDAIMELAERKGIAVIEDNAHGLFGKYKDRNLGTFGCLAAQSFHETKNVSCGEGGALLINDPALEQRAEIIREKGTDRTRFFRGEIDKYTWVDIGSSYLPSDILAAFLYAQLEARDEIMSMRRLIWQTYAKGLASWADQCGVRLAYVPDYCEQTFHVFYMLLPSEASRDALMLHLKQRGILSVFHYLPLHLSKMGKLFGGKEGQCPVTESVSGRLLRLPFYNGMSPEEQEAVIGTILEFQP